MALSKENTAFGLVLLQKSRLYTYRLELLTCISLTNVRSLQGNMRLILVLYRIPRLWLLEKIKLSCLLLVQLMHN